MPDYTEEYLKLITSEHYDKPNYYNYVKSFLDLCVSIDEVLESFDSIFKLENASGDQLDKIGELVGVSRRLPIDDPYIDSVLSDSTFRLVIKAKILKDHWDGSREGIESILRAIFPNLIFNIADNQNMSITITVVDPYITDEQIALVEYGYIIPKPSGVGVTYSISRSQLFGYDRSDTLIAGWDTGLWQMG